MTNASIYIWVRYTQKDFIKHPCGFHEICNVGDYKYLPLNNAMDICLHGRAVIRDDSAAGLAAEREVKRIQRDVAARRAAWGWDATDLRSAA